MKRLLSEFRRYALVGGVSFAVDFATLTALTELAGFHYQVAAAVAFSIGLVTIYALSIRYVFSFRSVANARHEFLLFAAIGIAGLLLNALFLHILTESVGAHYLLSKLVSAALIMLFNFGLRRHLLFSPRKTRDV